MSRAERRGERKWVGKRFSIRIMDGSISAERTTSDDAEKGSPLLSSLLSSSCSFPTFWRAKVLPPSLPLPLMLSVQILLTNDGWGVLAVLLPSLGGWFHSDEREWYLWDVRINCGFFELPSPTPTSLENVDRSFCPHFLMTYNIKFMQPPLSVWGLIQLAKKSWRKYWQKSWWKSWRNFLSKGNKQKCRNL